MVRKHGGSKVLGDDERRPKDFRFGPRNRENSFLAVQMVIFIQFNLCLLGN